MRASFEKTQEAVAPSTRSGLPGLFLRRQELALGSACLYPLHGARPPQAELRPRLAEGRLSESIISTNRCPEKQVRLRFPCHDDGSCGRGWSRLAGIALVGVVTAKLACSLIERVAGAEQEPWAATRRDVAALSAEVTALRAGRLQRAIYTVSRLADWLRRTGPRTT